MLRTANEKDLFRIDEIECASFSEPWSENALREALDNAAVRVIVSDDEGVEGFIIFSMIDGEAEVYDIAVAPESRKKGVGHALISYMLARAERAFLEVREGNRAAIALYKKCGFEPVAVRRAYYSNGENAVVMTAEGEMQNGSCIGN